MLIKINKKKNEKGFTLIELMIVIAIIGILAAIAIPQFAAYRKRSYNAASNADLKNATTAQEAYYVDKQIYADAVVNIQGATYGLYLSENVTITVLGGTVGGYSMQSFHTSGDKTWSIAGPGGSITS